MFECVVVVVLMSSWLWGWWSREVVGDGSGDGAGAAHCTDVVGSCVLSGRGAGAAHLDVIGEIVVVFVRDALRVNSCWARKAQKSSP